LTDDTPFIVPSPPIHYVPARGMDEDVVRAFGSVRRGRAAKRLAEALMSGQPVPLECIDPVARSLTEPSKNSWKENLVAVWAAARAAGHEDRYSASGWLSYVLEHWPSLDAWPRLRRSYVRTMIGLYVWLTLLSVMSGNVLPGQYFAPPFVAIPLCLLVYPVSAWVDRRRMNRVRREAARGLAHLAVPHSAAPLAAAALDGDEGVRRASWEALVAVLPTITEAHYGQLPLETTPRLCALLAWTDQTLAILVLRGLRAVGDSRAIRPVERLIQRAPGQSLDSEMRREADITLQVLYARQKREIDAASLLRPTMSPVEPEQSLLRPYLQTGDHPAENLLRATSDD
jgi:hypothetical protein